MEHGRVSSLWATTEVTVKYIKVAKIYYVSYFTQEQIQEGSASTGKQEERHQSGQASLTRPEKWN